MIARIIRKLGGKQYDRYDYADNLTQYGIAPRYPNEMNIDEEEAKYAVRQAGTILQWAKNIIADES